LTNERYRPLGVTLISILTVIGGIVFLGIGTILIVIGIGLGFIILGIVYFVMAYGLWNGRRWAWTITLIISGIGVIVGIASIIIGNFGSIISIIINSAIIYYLYRPDVKMFFGK
jgi:uncharacterized membrane protein (DUF2068 family)